MPNVQYVLVADAARARVLSRKGTKIEEVTSFEHPESRLQNRELQSDGPGRNQGQGGGPGSASDQPDAHRVEAEKFSRQIAETLRTARGRGDFETLVLVAPPQFLGMLRNALDAPTARLVTHSLAHDYTHVATHELAAVLQKHLSAEGVQDQT